MATFKLEMDCGNAAFDDDAAGEVARILGVVAKRIEGTGLAEIETGLCTDTNGNMIGRWEYSA